MDLPTYTSIWRIEKRLYKLYDFRLPMPLPIGQLGVFAAIAVPYVVLLEVVGLPFSHTLIWLYILPPGVLTWLATRPVLEGKRLPELVKSQARYLAEPRVWCRMGPVSEPDVVVLVGRVWRSTAHRAEPQPASRSELKSTASASRRREVTGVPRRGEAQVPAPRVAARRVPGLSEPGPAGLSFREPELPAVALREPAVRESPWREPPLRERPARERPAREQPARDQPAPEPALRERAVSSDAGRAVARARPAPAALAAQAKRSLGEQDATRPVITVVGASAQGAAPAVERALAGPSARRGDARPGRVTVVPGGHRPGKPDQLQRDRARAQLPIAAGNRVVVLGCTVGAGQTCTALLTGEVLAGLRSSPVAVLDLNPGLSSLAQRALARPALSQAASLGPSRLTVLDAGWYVDKDRDHDGEDLPDGVPADTGLSLALAAERYEIVVADPSTSAMPRLLAAADQLVLVAPASTAAASAITMTFEWLEAHGQADLAADAIMVLNGVSRRSLDQVEHAERVCVGRCRAIVRVPWDDQLNSQARKRSAMPASPLGVSQHGASQRGAGQPGVNQHWAGVLGVGTVGAYTALAGVLVAALAERHGPEYEDLQPAQVGQARQ